MAEDRPNPVFGIARYLQAHGIPWVCLNLPAPPVAVLVFGKWLPANDENGGPTAA
jgi:hypothetical protein